MSLHKDVIAEIEASEEGPHIGAFFDFDGTIIYGYSAMTFIREQVKRGDVSAKEFAELAAAMTSFGRQHWLFVNDGGDLSAIARYD
jgi:putative phosphoserine phosphatase / 1-acylglycerol-3-phosphate O-acyltransferase